MSKISTKKVNILTSIKKHTHDHAQVIFSTKEDLIIETDTNVYVANEQKYIYIPPKVHHKYYSHSKNETIVINIPENIIAARRENFFLTCQHVDMDEKIKLTIKLISLEIDENPDEKSIEHLILYLYNKISNVKTYDSIKYLMNHLEESVSVSILAKIENYNTNYYCDWFKKQMGMTPKDYIQQLRMEKSKALLITTNFTISQIALQVGYNQLSSFTRAFKAANHILPSDYRKKYQ